MSEFERQIYADMKSTDRISIWIIKCMELAEFSCILTDEDIDGIARKGRNTQHKARHGACSSRLYLLRAHCGIDSVQPFAQNLLRCGHMLRALCMRVYCGLCRDYRRLLFRKRCSERF